MHISSRDWSYLQAVTTYTSRSALCSCRQRRQTPHSIPVGFRSLYRYYVTTTQTGSRSRRAKAVPSKLKIAMSQNYNTTSKLNQNGKVKHCGNEDTSPANDPKWVSIVDRPVRLVSANKKHTFGIIVLALIPITAFALGTWQVQRLGWKTDLIARFEDSLVREPLPLPPSIDPNVVPEFDYRRVYTRGRFRHDQEMLVGPRIRDGENGYQVLTPLERADSSDGPGSKILVCRGWILKDKRERANRDPSALPINEVMVQGLLREPFKKNMFTPDNQPDKKEFYFPDIKEMADLTDSQPVWIEETIDPNLHAVLDRKAKGIPIGRVAEVNLRNNHLQYIFTWYGLSFATSVMFWMVFRRPKGGPSSNSIRHSREWL